MLKIFSSHNRRHCFVTAQFVLLLLALSAAGVSAQSVSQSNSGDGHGSLREALENGKKTETVPVAKKTSTTEEKLDALTQMVEQQNERLNKMQQTISAQQETIRLLMGRAATDQPVTAAAATASVPVETGSPSAQAPTVEDRLKKVETRVSEIGAIKFSGDIRLRSESIFGQQNILANGDNPAVLGNDLTPRNRMRLRARFEITGKFDTCKGEEDKKCDKFEWGLRLASGSFADNISTNQTLTDFFNRKPFALDQAYLTYKPKWAPALQLQGGKFTPPWAPTEMTIDTDLMVEGFNESYTYTKPEKKNSKLQKLTFLAWQLPFLERNSAFVRNANGTVNIDQSRRGGRDLALYGGQIRALLESSSRQTSCAKTMLPKPPKDLVCPAKLKLDLSVADLYYSGTQFISPVQVFGNQLMLPLTFTIPASGGTPAQTITTQVAISRDLLVAGNGGLGLTNASNNATNRDGRLASGYNLVDMIARLEMNHSERWPVKFVFNFVTNTQTHDVVVAGPGGGDLLLRNREKNGFWGELQVGRTVLRGDTQFSYTFMRIQKDAVLTPFNMSDITQQSDMRGHRFQFNYAVISGERKPGEKPPDPRVTFTVIGIVTERPNGLLGPFAATPPGSLNRSTFRLQFDTVLKF